MQTEHTTIYETPVQITVSDEKVYAYLQVEPDAVMCFVGEAPITKEAVVAYCREYLMSDLAKGRSVQYKDTFILRGKRKKYGYWLINQTNEMVGCVDEDNCFQLISVSFNKGKFEYTLPEDCSTDFADGFQYSGIERLMTINQLLDNGYSSKVAINDCIGSVMGYLSIGHFAKFGYEVAVHFADHRSHSTLAMEHMFNNVLPPLLHDEEILLGITELKIGCLVWDVEVSKKQINELDFKLERSMIIHFPSTTVVTVFELSKRQ